MGVIVLVYLIKLSLYQHLCCIVSLIVSFCSIKSPIFAVLSIFLHAFSVFDLSVICTPNGKTAEPEYYRRARPKKEWVLVRGAALIPSAALIRGFTIGIPVRSPPRGRCVGVGVASHPSCFSPHFLLANFS